MAVMAVFFIFYQCIQMNVLYGLCLISNRYITNISTTEVSVLLLFQLCVTAVSGASQACVVFFHVTMASTDQRILAL